VTVSARWSGSLTAAEQRRLLGLPIPNKDNQAPHTKRLRSSRPSDIQSGTLATELAGRLGCAVSYHNLGNYLHIYARQPAEALASHLIAKAQKLATAPDITEGASERLADGSG
jgi:hypothetical protein